MQKARKSTKEVEGRTGQEQEEDLASLGHYAWETSPVPRAWCLRWPSTFSKPRTAPSLCPLDLHSSLPAFARVQGEEPLPGVIPQELYRTTCHTVGPQRHFVFCLRLPQNQLLPPHFLHTQIK
jgi:hypothetical protein